MNFENTLHETGSSESCLSEIFLDLLKNSIEVLHTRGKKGYNSYAYGKEFHRGEISGLTDGEIDVRKIPNIKPVV